MRLLMRAIGLGGHVLWWLGDHRWVQTGSSVCDMGVPRPRDSDRCGHTCGVGIGARLRIAVKTQNKAKGTVVHRAGNAGKEGTANRTGVASVSSVSEALLGLVGRGLEACGLGAAALQKVAHGGPRVGRCLLSSATRSPELTTTWPAHTGRRARPARCVQATSLDFVASIMVITENSMTWTCGSWSHM